MSTESDSCMWCGDVLARSASHIRSLALQRLADFVAEETGIRLSYEGVRLLLKAHDIVLSRPQHKISSPDPEYEVKKKRLRISETR